MSNFELVQDVGQVTLLRGDHPVASFDLSSPLALVIDQLEPGDILTYGVGGAV